MHGSAAAAPSAQCFLLCPVLPELAAQEVVSVRAAQAEAEAEGSPGETSQGYAQPRLASIFGVPHLRAVGGGPGLPPAMPSARRRANNPQRKGHNNQPVVADTAAAEGGGEAGRAQQSEGGGGGGGGSFMKEGAWGGGR